MEIFLRDPHMYRGEVMNKTGYEVLKMIDRVKAAGVSAVTMPLLVMHGAEDEIALSKSSQTVYDGAPSTDKRIHIFPV